MLTEREQNSTERIENGYRTGTERIQNGYGTDTEQIQNRNGNACRTETERVLSSVPVRFLLIGNVARTFITVILPIKVNLLFLQGFNISSTLYLMDVLLVILLLTFFTINAEPNT